jgi:hypothetical protein
MVTGVTERPFGCATITLHRAALAVQIGGLRIVNAYQG